MQVSSAVPVKTMGRVQVAVLFVLSFFAWALAYGALFSAAGLGAPILQEIALFAVLAAYTVRGLVALPWVRSAIAWIASKTDVKGGLAVMAFCLAIKVGAQYLGAL